MKAVLAMFCFSGLQGQLTAFMFGWRSKRIFCCKRIRLATSNLDDVLDGARSGRERQDGGRLVGNLLGPVVNRAVATLSDRAGRTNSVSDERQTRSYSSYNENPSVTNIALAHLKWSRILRPGVDAAIDATCGNGHDAAFLASLLFPNGVSSSILICIDVQPGACEATRQRLSDSVVDSKLMDSNIQIVCDSHAKLPKPTEPVGLVCYNLGYLPGSQKKEIITQMQSTIESIVQATLMLRIGGLISVMTYPNTNANEDYAVHALLEGLSLLTSKEVDWEAYLDELGPDPDGSQFSVRDTVKEALHRVKADGAPKQTWRVMQHRTMGRPLSPILLTATRIK